MDDDERARHERLLKEQTDLQRALERSRERVGVDPEDLHRVAAAALVPRRLCPRRSRGQAVGKVETYRLDPNDPAFTKDAGWDDAFDDLRVRPRKRGERLGDWRRDAPIRSIAFSPPSWLMAAMLRTSCRCISSIDWSTASVSLPQPGVSVEAVTRVGHLSDRARSRVSC